MTADLEHFRNLYGRVGDAYGRMTAKGPIAVREPLTIDLLRAHLEGRERIGAYFLDAEGLADQLVFDDDENRPDLVKRLLSILDELGIEAYAETSKSKGFHVRTHWEPAPAADLRRVGAFVAQRSGVPDIEVFPKQDQRGGEDKLGNFMWLPMHGESLKSGKTAIVDGSNGLTAPPDQWEACHSIQINSLETLANALAVVEEAGGPPTTTKKREPVPDAIPVGKRRDTLTRIAGANRRLGLGEAEIYPILAEVNRTRCGDHPVPDEDVRAISKSILRYPPEAPIVGKDAVPVTGTDIGPKAPLFASLATLLANPRPQRWLVKGLIEAPSTVMIFGPSGSGKTFIADDLAGATATGGEWMGRQVSAGRVFYISGEGNKGQLRRFQAWQLKRKVTIPEGRLFLSVVSIELNASGAAEVTAEAERRAQESGEPPALIIVDTLSRAMPAGNDENSVKDMMAFVKAVDQIRDRFDCVAVIVHHAGVADDKRARGSTSLKAAMDAELCVTRRGTVRTAEWTKLKDLPDEPHPQEFTLEPELLGQDEDGNLITSAVVAWKGRTTAKASATTTKAETLGLETLRAASAGSDSTNLGAWRTAFYAKHWGDNDDAKQKSFRRIRESLAGKKLIVIDGDCYSIPRQGDRT